MPTPWELEQTRLIQYRDIFGTPSGKAVLKDLRQKYLMTQNSKACAFENSATGLAYIAGQSDQQS